LKLEKKLPSDIKKTLDKTLQEIDREKLDAKFDKKEKIKLN
jgi:hypothetical protein